MNQAPVFMRITLNGTRIEIATNRKFDKNRWSGGRPIGTKEDAKNLQKHLDKMRIRAYEIQSELIRQKEPVTAERIKGRFLNWDKSEHSLIEIFEYHNKQLKSMVGMDYSTATATRYDTTLAHIKSFLKTVYKTEDIYLSELNYEFITNLEFYFKTTRQCNHNTTMKYIKNFRKVINLAVKNEWLLRDPFARFSCTIKPVERECLNKDELSALETKTILLPRIEQVRDVFVFCCYTGLAYVDVQKLSANHIVTGIDGEKWLLLNRTKTDTRSMIPLLPQAISILEKYNPGMNYSEEKLLPVSSNQKMNAYLKELAAICGINKDLTFHIARHTFATTVTLTHGVSIESVSAMLGHKNIRTTQIYSKVVEQKISADMLSLRDKLTGQSRLSKQNAIAQE